MIYLVFSIACSSAIFILFKYFEQFKVHTFTAIVINYLIAACTGFLAIDDAVSLSNTIERPWFYNALILGVIFILLFNIMAITAQRIGPSVASIANKMALIVPVVFAIYFYGDSLTIFKFIGIVMALAGIFLATFKPKSQRKTVDKALFLIPIILFLGSGFIDTFIKYNEEFYLLEGTSDAKLFPAFIFSTAFLLGLGTFLFKNYYHKLSIKTIIGGIILGAINYGSIFFLIQAFKQTPLDSSEIFPINNMGVVIVTAISSYLIFKERFSKANLIGVFFSIAAIFLIVFGR